MPRSRPSARSIAFGFRHAFGIDHFEPEAAHGWPVFGHNTIEGSFVGFRFPDYTVGLNAPGYHLHFISPDRTVGGHVLEISTRRAHVAIDVTSDFHMELPEAGDFLGAKLAHDNDAAAIDEIEKWRSSRSHRRSAG